MRNITSALASPYWLYGFLLIQFISQASLSFDVLGSLRFAFRVLGFASSLFMLLLVLIIVHPPGTRKYPLQGLALVVVMITAVELLHPGLNTPLAGIAQIGLTLSVWAPIFWVGSIRITRREFRIALLLLWGFHSLSAAYGVLQVYDPARFAPDPTFVRSINSEATTQGLLVELDDGQKVFRPMGLSDTPGGAAVSGQFAVVGGLGIALVYRSILMRAAVIAAAAIGMFCIYLCQIRTTLIVTGISLLGMTALMAFRGQITRAIAVSVVAALGIAGGFVWATTIGKEAVTGRLETLTKDSSTNVVYQSRGIFIEELFTVVIPECPFGAGLGRYGMMHSYFGTSINPDSLPLWVEIQPTGWMFDGGILLLLSAYAAVIGACWIAARYSYSARDQQSSDLAAVVAAFSLGVLVNTFGYCSFFSQTGILFWVLNRALFSVIQNDAALLTARRFVPSSGPR